MGFLGDILGGLFGGGGGTKVTQKTTSQLNSTVNVAVENTIDMSGLTAAFNKIAEIFQSSFAAEAQQMDEQEKQRVVLALLTASAEEKKAQTIGAGLDTANKIFKQLAYGVLTLGGIFLLWRMMK